MDKVAHADGNTHQDLRWCIGKAASKIEEFYMLPKDGKLYKYDRMAINVIADNVKGGLSFCDVAVCDDLETFNANYMHLTETISRTCQDILDDEAVIVGTSAVTGTELDSITNQYSGSSTASPTSIAASSTTPSSAGAAIARAG